MTTVVSCPACGSTEFDLAHYDSMMVLCPDLALFGLRCPQCGTTVSSICTIPEELCSEIERAAAEMGAGMGFEAPNR